MTYSAHVVYSQQLRLSVSARSERNGLHVRRVHRNFLRRASAFNAEVWAIGPNKNHISIAFSIEGNSGMNSHQPSLLHSCG
jgi:hypothetical protein